MNRKAQHDIELEFIKPGRPMQNVFIERSIAPIAKAFYDMHVFQTLSEVREVTNLEEIIRTAFNPYATSMALMFSSLRK